MTLVLGRMPWQARQPQELPWRDEADWQLQLSRRP